MMRQTTIVNGDELRIRVDIDNEDVFTADFEQYAKTLLLVKLVSGWSQGGLSSEEIVANTRHELETRVISALCATMRGVANEFDGPTLDRQLKELLGENYKKEK